MEQDNRKEKILVVDDVPATIDMLKTVLEEDGYEVVMATSGEKAIKRAELTDPDLILLDVLMPEMDGFETCRRLKANRKTREIPIMFMTALTTTEKIVTGFKVGGIDYVTKPIEIEEVSARLKTHLALRNMHNQLIEQNERLKHEMTQRKQVEDALQRSHEKLKAANQELEAFVYSVSHDLRAPLRHINGFLELLKKKTAEALDEQNRHYMDAISDGAKKMGLLIDDLLSFSRMGRHALSFQQVDLGTLVRKVIRELEPDAAGRDIEWRLGDLPVVSGDAAMLRMVMDNLISNALKFTRPRKQARIEIGSLSGQPSETVIYVRDNGVGFDMTYVDKLFGVFQRLHRADEFEGTGIGLANVRRIITQHGGRTWAEGKVNQDATFYFSLPQT